MISRGKFRFLRDLYQHNTKLRQFANNLCLQYQLDSMCTPTAELLTRLKEIEQRAREGLIIPDRHLNWDPLEFVLPTDRSDQLVLHYHRTKERPAAATGKQYEILTFNPGVFNDLEG